MRSEPSESVDWAVTSPPYWGLRDYGTAKWKGGRRIPGTVLSNEIEYRMWPGAIKTGCQRGKT